MRVSKIKTKSFEKVYFSKKLLRSYDKNSLIALGGTRSKTR